MKVWTVLEIEDEQLTAATGMPGDEPLTLEVSVAPGSNNRTRIIASNGDVALEMLLEPENLSRLLRILQRGEKQIQAAVIAGGDTGWTPQEEITKVDLARIYEVPEKLLNGPGEIQVTTPGVDETVFDTPPARAHESLFGKWCYCTDPDNPSHKFR